MISAIFCFVIFLLLFFIFKCLNGKKSGLFNSGNKNPLPFREGYARKNFLTNREREFYNAISGITGKNYFLLTQVRLIDIVQPKASRKDSYALYMKLFRNILQYHVDFVPARKNRDNKINDILNGSDILFMRSKDQKLLLADIKEHFS